MRRVSSQAMTSAVAQRLDGPGREVAEVPDRRPTRMRPTGPSDAAGVPSEGRRRIAHSATSAPRAGRPDAAASGRTPRLGLDHAPRTATTAASCAPGAGTTSAAPPGPRSQKATSIGNRMPMRVHRPRRPQQQRPVDARRARAAPDPLARDGGCHLQRGQHLAVPQQPPVDATSATGRAVDAHTLKRISRTSPSATS